MPTSAVVIAGIDHGLAECVRATRRARISAAACGTSSRRDRAGRRSANLIAHAIAPIWEANHVWLILVIVLLFTCFPARVLDVRDHAPHSADAHALRHRAARLGVRRSAATAASDERDAAALGTRVRDRERRHARAARACAWARSRPGTSMRRCSRATSADRSPSQFIAPWLTSFGVRRRGCSRWRSSPFSPRCTSPSRRKSRSSKTTFVRARSGPPRRCS